jgi:BCD family chlorophyll transporter-like MFS transporter
MAAARPDERGLALGAWGAAQATAAGLAIALSGFINDAVGALAVNGALGEALTDPVAGYCAVYGIEILLLLAAIIAVGPLSRKTVHPAEANSLCGSPSIGFNPGGLS